MHLAVFTKLLV